MNRVTFITDQIGEGALCLDIKSEGAQYHVILLSRFARAQQPSHLDAARSNSSVDEFENLKRNCPMIVKMLDGGRGVTSLRVGAYNVKKYFTKAVSTVDLDLESVQIRCDLSREFWRDQPEIADPRLCAWLTAKSSSWKSDGRELVLRMLPAGTNSFRILPVKSRSGGSEHSYDPAA